MKKLLLALLVLVLAVSPITQAATVGCEITTATTNGTVRAGCLGLVFIFSADFAGTIDGETFSGATDAFFAPPVQHGDRLAAITYTVTAGNIRIAETR